MILTISIVSVTMSYQVSKEYQRLAEAIDALDSSLSNLNPGQWAIPLEADISALKREIDQSSDVRAEIARLADRVERLSFSVAERDAGKETIEDNPHGISVEHPLVLFDDLPPKFKKRVDQAANLFLRYRPPAWPKLEWS